MQLVLQIKLQSHHFSYGLTVREMNNEYTYLIYNRIIKVLNHRPPKLNCLAVLDSFWQEWETGIILANVATVYTPFWLSYTRSFVILKLYLSFTWSYSSSAWNFHLLFCPFPNFHRQNVISWLKVFHECQLLVMHIINAYDIVCSDNIAASTLCKPYDKT